MCAPKSSPYWKSNSFWPDFSTGIASFSPLSLASWGTVPPNCSSTSTPTWSLCTEPVSVALTMPS